MSASAFFDNQAEIRRAGFIGLNCWGLRRVRQLIKEGQLRRVDLPVLIGLAELANRRTGLVPASTTLLASIDGMPCHTTIQYSLRRLEEACLVRRVSSSRRSSQALLLLSPAVFNGVKEELAYRHHLAWAREQDAVPPPPPTEAVLRAGIA